MTKFILAVLCLLPLAVNAADPGAVPGTGGGGQDGKGTGGGGGDAGGMGMMLMLPLVFGLMYFIVIRPQRREEKKKKELIAALKKGDQVVTIGGLHGEVIAVGETTIDIRAGVDDGTVLRFSKGAVASVPTADKGN